MHGRPLRTPKNAAKFCEALATTGNVTESCKQAGIARRTAYEWRAADPGFAKDWDDAIEAGLDELEQECKRRGLRGYDEPVFYKGEEVGAIKRYSDTLAIFLLKGGRPEKYRERFDHNIAGKAGGPIEIEFVNDWRASAAEDTDGGK